MAQVLSIIGEAGLAGFGYDSGVSYLSKTSYQSKRLRYSLAPSPQFSAEEFRHFLAYAARAGYVDACPDQGRLANGELSEKEWHLMLTLEGWRHIERYDRPILHQWGANLRDNVPSIIVSIFAAVVIAWLLREFGFEK